MKQIDLREGARRQHRAVALLGALQCWIRGLDGLVFNRPELERLLGLHRFKQTRVEWLRSDFCDLFPYSQVFVTEQNETIYAFLATRKRLRKGFKELSGYMGWCKRNGVQVADFSIWPTTILDRKESSSEALVPFSGHSINSDERLLTAYLSLIAAGQMSPLDIPKIKA